MKTNSNSYTIIYSAVIVVVVAFLLAFVYQALKPMQTANEAWQRKSRYSIASTYADSTTTPLKRNTRKL